MRGDQGRQLPKIGIEQTRQIFGTGRTVIRGGWGQYRFHDEQNVQAGALGITQGQFGYCVNGCNGTTFNELANYQPTFVAPGSITVLDPNDSEQPMTRSYSFTVSERVPWQSLFEISYVGNQSSHLSNWNNNLFRPNQLGYGALYANPAVEWTAANNYSPNADPFRPYQNYSGAGGIKIINHEMYSNYNSLQASWNKQAGRVNWLLNYTFSKSLGIRGEGGGPTGDPTNLANNYGTLGNDRTHIFNAAYVIEMPHWTGGNMLARGVLNGWQVSARRALGLGRIRMSVTLGTGRFTYGVAEGWGRLPDGWSL